MTDDGDDDDHPDPRHRGALGGGARAPMCEHARQQMLSQQMELLLMVRVLMSAACLRSGAIALPRRATPVPSPGGQGAVKFEARGEGARRRRWWWAAARRWRTATMMNAGG